MYIVYDNVKYENCNCSPNKGNVIYKGLPEEFPAPINGTITIYSNDGMRMRSDEAENYLRQTFENGELTLTNAPETEETEIAEEPEEEEYNIEIEEEVLE